ncbi:MAG: peptidylprolyl isomerase [Phycisphaeraceae bacterium]
MLIGLTGLVLAACQAGSNAGGAAGSGQSPQAAASSKSAPPASPVSGDSTAAYSSGDRGSTPLPAKPLAYVDGRPVTAGALLPALVETAGGRILAETVIDQGLRQRLEQARLKVTAEQIEAERQILLHSLAADRDQAQRLLDELRQRRALGQQRFAALLWRNAAMRVLVQDQVAVSDAAVRQMYELVYGPRFEARIIVTEGAGQAADLARQAREGASFIDLAIQHSTDVSRAQGGLLPTISPQDATFPAGIREALARLQPGQVSDPVALDRGFALLKLERKIAGGAVRYDDVKSELTLHVRRQAQRIEMQRLAREIVTGANVVITDPGLKESYTQQKDRLLAE